ncbi:MAG: hypothetical protein WBQ73_04000 [Candidatus Babeliales bacterium]
MPPHNNSYHYSYAFIIYTILINTFLFGSDPLPLPLNQPDVLTDVNSFQVNLVVKEIPYDHLTLLCPDLSKDLYATIFFYDSDNSPTPELSISSYLKNASPSLKLLTNNPLALLLKQEIDHFLSKKNLNFFYLPFTIFCCKHIKIKKMTYPVYISSTSGTLITHNFHDFNNFFINETPLAIIHKVYMQRFKDIIKQIPEINKKTLGYYYCFLEVNKHITHPLDSLKAAKAFDHLNLQKLINKYELYVPEPLCDTILKYCACYNIQCLLSLLIHHNGLYYNNARLLSDHEKQVTTQSFLTTMRTMYLTMININ